MPVEPDAGSAEDGSAEDGSVEDGSVADGSVADAQAPVQCELGWQRKEDGGCVEVDDCAAEPCGAVPNACIDSVASFSCDCARGYIGTGTTSCTDVDECETDHGGCDPLVSCTNLEGGRICGECPAYHRGSGDTRCVRLWTREFGSSAHDGAEGIATDASGSVYLTGSTFGELDGYANTTQINMFLVKLDRDGNKQWLRQLATTARDSGAGVAADRFGYVFVTGTSYGGLFVANGSGYRPFVVKYDSSGQQLWVREPAFPVSANALAVAADTHGSVVFVGEVRGSITPGQSSVTADMLIVKYDDEGNQTWARQLDSGSFDQAFGVATDAADNIYVTGINSGNANNDALGGDDVALVKYDPDGELMWRRRFGSPRHDYGHAVAVDRDGNAFVAASTESEDDLSVMDLLLLKYDNAGQLLWSRQLHANGSCTPFSVAVDESGSAYLSGVTGAEFEGQPNAGGADFLIVKYSGDGERLWIRVKGSSAMDRSLAVTVDADGAIYATGESDGDVDGNTNAGESDVLVVKFAADGQQL